MRRPGMQGQKENETFGFSARICLQEEVRVIFGWNRLPIAIWKVPAQHVNSGVDVAVARKERAKERENANESRRLYQIRPAERCPNQGR
jgi:hypothetical protein